jgi:Rod binding domain-containing protein
VILPVDSSFTGISPILAPHTPGVGGTSRTAPLSDNPADRKLRKAAGEFESMLLSNLWKSMKSTFADPDEDSGDPAHDTLEDWGIDAMAGAVGKAGGLGLGKLILKHLEPALLNFQNGSAPQASNASPFPADNLE